MSNKISKNCVRRVLLEYEPARLVSELVLRLRENSCKTDTSKLVNEIVKVFFEKYESTEYDNIMKVFFDKKSYLKKLINDVSVAEIDESIKKYLSQNRLSKKRGRKAKKEVEF